MRILYVARHGQGLMRSNDDEGAIAHGLRALGHTVTCVQEKEQGMRPQYLVSKANSHDLLLFHSWPAAPAVEVLSRLDTPKVFWYFDLVDWPDHTVQRRTDERIAWMQAVTPLVDLGFCTDGDWVSRDTTDKLVWLPQGADERIAKPGKGGRTIRILFTGTESGGVRRRSFVNEMRYTYGQLFRQHAGRYRVHGRALADIISRSRIVVAPDGPVTDNYWSNRVYLSLGFQAFMLHPYASKLATHYEDQKEIVFYRSREELHGQIAYYLQEENETERQQIQQAGYHRTMMEHTYRHRCEYLLQTVKERLL